MLIVIKNNYLFVLEFVVYLNEIIKEVIGVNLSEDDIGFIVLYFVVVIERFKENVKKNKKDVIIVCEIGIGILFLLKVRLEGRFKERIDIVEIIFKYEFNENVLNNFDLIIFIVFLGVDFSKIVYVKSFLDSDEINLIDEKFNGNLLSGNFLVNKFKEELFFDNLEGDIRDEILESIIEVLINKGYISERVRDDVFKRENLVSIEIGGLVVIFYSMSEDINKFFIFVLLLSKIIIWSKEKV